MPKKNNDNLKKKLFIAAGVLFTLQIGMIVYFKFVKTRPSPKDSIADAVDKAAGVSSDRKPIIRLQLALAQYKSKNGGKLPSTLNQLIPTYIASVPNGADGNPIKYVVDGKNYRLGDEQISNSLNASSVKSSSDSKVSKEDKEKLIASFDANIDSARPIYDATGKRDPFKPINLSPKEDKRRELTPLENYTLDKLSYSAFIKTDATPKAVLENTEGRGFTVTIGTKVGPNSGTITDIFPDKIVVVESTTDLTGKTSSLTYEFLLGVKGSKSQKRK